MPARISCITPTIKAAFRLSKRILLNDGSANKRIILVTDGHPSACFMDDVKQQEKILKIRPYSHFYKPDALSVDSVRAEYDLRLNVSGWKSSLPLLSLQAGR